MWGKDEGYFVHRGRSGDSENPSTLRALAGAANPAAAHRPAGYIS